MRNFDEWLKINQKFVLFMHYAQTCPLINCWKYHIVKALKNFQQLLHLYCWDYDSYFRSYVISRSLLPFCMINVLNLVWHMYDTYPYLYDANPWNLDFWIIRKYFLIFVFRGLARAYDLNNDIPQLPLYKWWLYCTWILCRLILS